MGFTYIDLPKDRSLYEPSAEDFLSRIDEICDLGESGTPQVAVFVQSSPTTDLSQTWFIELKDEVLLPHVEKRLADFRKLLRKIRNSKTIWVFAGAYDCYGSFADLAFSCDYRFWFSERARLGYPDLKRGVFPSGGILDETVDDERKDINGWFEKPTASALSLCRKKLVQIAFEDSNWQSALSAFIERQVSPSLSAQQDKTAKVAAKLTDQEDLLEGFDLQKLSEEIGFDYTKSWSYSDLCLALLKKRKKISNPKVIAPIIVHCSAKSLVSDAYIMNFSRHLMRRPELPLADAMARKAYAINLDYLIPPTNLLLDLLVMRHQLVLFASESSGLVNALEILYSRIEKAVGSKKAYQLWVNVGWCVSVRMPAQTIGLEFTLDDLMVLRQNQEVLSVLRLESNFSGSQVGFVEVESEALSKASSAMLVEIDRLSTGKIVTTPSQLGDLSPVVYIRSAMLAELTKVSSHFSGSIVEIVQILGNMGWGFLGDSDRIDKFLKVRQSEYIRIEGIDKVLLEIEDSEIWDLGTWAQLKNMLRKTDSPGVRWNVQRLLRHIVIESLRVADYLFEKQAFASLRLADQAVYVALGFPETVGSPDVLRQKYSPQRISVYESFQGKEGEV